MKKLIFAISILFSLIACSGDNNDSVNKEIERLSKIYPKCVVDKIKTTYQAEFHGTTTVKKYSYNGEVVYEFNYDMTVVGGEGGSFSVINENCKNICGGGGGIVYTNTCIDWDKATLIETVWTDPR